jgi:hypothetical protein
MRYRVVVTGILGGLLFAGWLSAEGLGEAAAKEKARRESLAKRSTEDAAKAPSRVDCSTQRSVPWRTGAPDLRRPAGSSDVSGAVELELLVGEGGVVREAEVKRTTVDDKLAEAAKQNALQQRYCPAYKDGAPVEARLLVRFEFRAGRDSVAEKPE